MSVGRSGDRVFRLPGAFAKVAGGDEGAALLQSEVEALIWLAGRAGAPRVLWRGRAGHRPTIVTSAVPGVPLYDAPEAERAIAAAIRCLATLHALPVAACPIDGRLAVRLPQARQRLELGLVDEADFDDSRAGRSGVELLAEVMASVPAGEDLVVTHGDACWPNLIVDGDACGIIDLGRFGVADRWQDLALFLRSAAYNAPDVDAPALLKQHYGLGEIDSEKVAFYQLLDEFF